MLREKDLDDDFSLTWTAVRGTSAEVQAATKLIMSATMFTVN
jgi:hypothetical protein